MNAITSVTRFGSPLDEESRRGTVGVVVIDHHLTFGELLGRAIDRQDDLTFIGTAATAAEGLDLVEATGPEVVVMDVDLHDRDGLQLVEQIRSRDADVRVIVVTGSVDPFIVHRAAQAGACAFLTKNGGLSQLFETIHSARPGRMIVDCRLLANTSPVGAAGPVTGRAPTSPKLPDLTPRERQVLQNLALGLDATKIARKLTISTYTCRDHIKAILAKLHCHSQVEALATATRLGLVPLPPPSAPSAGPRAATGPSPDHANRHWPARRP